MKKILPLLLAFITFAWGARIKDIASIEGFKPTYLMGYGLVVGLKGTGDGTSVKFTIESIANMLKRFGIVVNPNQLTLKNVAAVMVTATVPPYAKTGMKFDVVVSAIGDAKSIDGGTLLMTPLKGPDGNVYAVAQGTVITKGYGNRLTGKRYPNVGVVINGGIMERDLPFIISRPYINILLNHPDITTAHRIAKVINEHFGKKLAYPVDSATVRVKIPPFTNPIDFLSQVEQLEVQPDSESVVVIDSHSGTVIFGGKVKIKPVVLSVEGLVLRIKKYAPQYSPYPTSYGPIVGENPPQNPALIQEEERKYNKVQAATIDDLVNVLNELGLSPIQIINVIQALKRAGAIEAKVIVE